MFSCKFLVQILHGIKRICAARNDQIVLTTSDLDKPTDKPLWLDIEVTATAMACIVENYNLALAPSASSALTLPGSLRAKLSVAVPETLFNVSPRPLHSLSQELCSSEYSLQSTSSQTSSSDCTAAEMSPARVPPRAVSIATRAEPSSLSGTADRLSQLGRPSAALAAHIHRSMRKREAVLPPLQLASPQLHKRCVAAASTALQQDIYIIIL